MLTVEKLFFFTDGLDENRNFPPITPDLNLVIDTIVSDDYRELYRLFLSNQTYLKQGFVSYIITDIDFSVEKKVTNGLYVINSYQI